MPSAIEQFELKASVGGVAQEQLKGGARLALDIGR